MNGREGKRTVLLVSSLSSFLTPIAASSFNIALPTIGTELSMDAVSLSWASLAYLLSAAIFLVPFGSLADIYGRKRVFLYGTSIFAATSLMLALFPSGTSIIIFRAMQGVGAAMIFGTSVAILVAVFSERERGLVLGINSACVYVGLSIGPLYGGFLTQNLGWRSIFFGNVVLCLAIIVLTLLGLKGEWTEAAGEMFDVKGSAVYGVTLFSVMYGFSLLPSVSSLLPLGIGVVGAFAFIQLSTRSKNPVLDIGLFKHNRVFAFSNAAALINYGATYAVTFLMSLYLQYLRGLSPEDAGLILISTPIVQAIFSPITGRLSDRIEARKVAAVGMAVTSMSMLPLILIDESTSMLYIVSCLALLGFGLALFVSPNTNSIMGSVERRLYGVAASMFGTMRLIGQMLSMGIALVIFAVLIGRVEITPIVYPLLTGSVRTAFTVFLILCIIGIFASLVKSGDTKR